ncbi:MAG: hypothetical protein LKF13_04960 [Atopobiaceae bacterium]|nr:hypothetical protein [Atopobiaceae bacterium]
MNGVAFAHPDVEDLAGKVALDRKRRLVRLCLEKDVSSLDLVADLHLHGDDLRLVRRLPGIGHLDFLDQGLLLESAQQSLRVVTSSPGEAWL